MEELQANIREPIEVYLETVTDTSPFPKFVGLQRMEATTMVGRLWVRLAAIAFVAMVVAGCAPTATPTAAPPVSTPTVLPTATAVPSSTPSLPATPTSTPTAAPTPAPPLDLTVLWLAPDVTLELVRVPAGPFLMGSVVSESLAYDEERPLHMVMVDDYFIGRYEVTVSQFAAFVKATGYRTTREVVHPDLGYDWRRPSGPAGLPVAWVSWDDAVAFTRWASQVTGWAVRLPTEAEWEKAARGTDGRKYPWGNEPPDATRGNFNSNVGEKAPVWKYSPQGDSAYGAANMIGNVWEWTASLSKPYPYQADDGRENASIRGSRVLRGCSFDCIARYVRATIRFGTNPGDSSDNFGFRVAATAR